MKELCYVDGMRKTPSDEDNASFNSTLLDLVSKMECDGTVPASELLETLRMLWKHVGGQVEPTYQERDGGREQDAFEEKYGPVYEPRLGADIADVAARMVEMAESTNLSVRADFNGVYLRARPWSYADDVVEQYQKSWKP